MNRDNLQLIQPVWFEFSNPRCSMGGGISPLRLEIALQISARPSNLGENKTKKSSQATRLAAQCYMI